MTEPRLCPLYCTDCAGERLRMEQHPEFRDWACPQCGIAGPVNALDRVTPRSRKFTKEELAQLEAMPSGPLEPWDELEEAAEEQDPGHLLRVNADLRRVLSEERGAAKDRMRELDARIAEQYEAAKANGKRLDAALLTLGCVEETFAALTVELGYTGKPGDIEALAEHIGAMRAELAKLRLLHLTAVALDVPPQVGDAVRWVINGKPYVGDVQEVSGPVESQSEPGKMLHLLSVRTGIWSTSCTWPGDVTHVLRAVGGMDVTGAHVAAPKGTGT